jgi:hypothetical protein
VTSKLSPELEKLVDALLEGTSKGDAIELDAVGEAIGGRAISQVEIEAVLDAIEGHGRVVRAPSRTVGQSEAILGRVLAAARALRQELKRAPRSHEIAERAGLSDAEVAQALALAKVIQS